MDKTEKAYIAGFIDADGCIYASKRKTRNSKTISGKVIIACTDKGAIEKISSMLGDEASRNSSSHKQEPNWKTMYRLEFSQQQGARLLRKILPYLIIKEEQAKLFIELAEIKSKSTRGNKHKEERQEEILKSLKEYNKRGT